jgi:hypothetical protein
MKTIIRIFAIVLITITTSCIAQQMVQTTADLYKLKTNEQQFANKPLKYLLNEVKPEIKIGVGNNEEGHQFFSYRFLSLDEIKQKVVGRKLVSLYVYVKEPIEWNFNNRPKGKEHLWTKEDAEKYGNLTVVRIKVIERIED